MLGHIIITGKIGEAQHRIVQERDECGLPSILNAAARVLDQQVGKRGACMRNRLQKHTAVDCTDSMSSVHLAKGV